MALLLILLAIRLTGHLTLRHLALAAHDDDLMQSLANLSVTPSIGAQPIDAARALSIAAASEQETQLAPSVSAVLSAQVPTQALLALVCWLRIMQVLFIFPSTGPLLLMAIRMLQVPHTTPIPLITPDHSTNDIHPSR